MTSDMPGSTGRLRAQIRDRLADAGIVVVGEAVAKVVAFLAIPIAAFFLTDAELGTLAIGLLVFALLLILYDFGMSGAALRLPFDSPSDGSVWWLLFTVIGVFVPLTYLVAPPVVDAVFTSIEFYPTLASVPIAAAAGATISVGQSTLRARFQFGSFTGLTLARTMGTVLPAVTVGAITGTAEGYLVGMTVGLVLVATATVIALRRSIGPPSTTLWRAALAFGLPLIPHLLFGLVMNLADRVLIERWVGLEELGQYALAYQLAWAVGALALALNNVWTPLLYRRSTEASVTAGDGMVARAAAPVSVGLNVLVIGVMIVAPLIYGIVRPSGVPDQRVFVAVGMASVVFSLYVLFVGPIFVRDKTWIIPIVTAVGAVVNLLGNIVLIPRLGIEGAAIATFTGYGASLLAVVMSEALLRFPRWYVVRISVIAVGQVVAGTVAILVSGWLAVVPAAIFAAMAVALVAQDRRRPIESGVDEPDSPSATGSEIDHHVSD